MSPKPADLIRATLTGLDHVDGTNYAQNPSFEHGLDAWFTSAGRTLSRGTYTDPAAGGQIGILQLTESVPANSGVPLFRHRDWAGLDVTPGEVWSFGMRVRANNDAQAVRLRIRQFDPTHANLATTPDIPVNFSQWHLVKVEGVVIPEGCNRIRLEVFAAVGGVPASAWYYVDAVQAHRSATLPAYFDGDTPAAGDHTYRWAGTPGVSASERVRHTQDVSPALQSCDITRGGSATDSGQILSVQVGTTTLALAGDYSHVRSDATLVVSHRQVTGQPLFTGRVQDVAVTYTKRDGQVFPRSVLSATDAVATLNNTMRYGSAIENQTFHNRMTALMSSAPEIPWQANTVTPLAGRQAAVVYESTLANHLTMTCNGAGTAWRINRTGQLITTSITRTPPEPGQVGTTFLSDGSRIEGGDTVHMPYGDITIAQSTRDQVTAVTLIDHRRRQDPDDPENYLADDRNLGPYVDPEAEARTGRRAATLHTSMSVSHDAAGAWWSTQFRVRRRPTWARLNARDWWHVDADRVPGRPINGRIGPTGLNRVLSLDIGSTVPVDFDGVRYGCYIAQIRHQITPENWHVEVALGDAGWSQ